MESETKLTLLKKFQKNVQNSFEYFRSNYERYIEFRNFTFNSTLSEDDISVLQEQMKPQLQFNIIKPFLDRQLGEFALQEPSFEVKNTDPNAISPDVVEIVQGYIEYNFNVNNRYNTQYDTFKETISGGFSVYKIYLEYEHERSFNQNICFKKVADPTMVGFDPMATESHKGDGEYCFEIYPMKLDHFERLYGKKYTKDMSFKNNFKEFGWSYESKNGEKVVLVCEYYYKVYEKTKLYLLLDGSTKTQEEYDQFLIEWTEINPLMPPPGIVGTPRETTFTKIQQCIFCETGIIQKKDTLFDHLPFIFSDCDSVMLRNSLTSAAYQHTLPMLYHAAGTQKLKNYAGNTLANELENMPQQKLMIPIESVLPQYIDALTKPQLPNVIMYSHFYKNDPTKVIAPPTPLPRVPAPPEIMQTFQMCDSLVQNVLGSYDAAIGISGNQVSGSAMSQGAQISNSVARPAHVNYLKALNRIAEIYIHLIPKIHKLPRTLPIVTKRGEQSYVGINGQDQVALDYDPNLLKINIEAGVSFEVQRERSFSMLSNLMQISPVLNELIGTSQSGIEMLLDNIDIRNIDRLKEDCKEFLEMKKAQAAQQSQMMQAQIQSQIMPLQIKKEEIELRAAEKQADNQVKASQLEVEKQRADTERLLALMQVDKEDDDKLLARMRLQQEEARNSVSAINAMNQSANLHHSHAYDLLKLHHEIEKNKNQEMKKPSKKSKENR